MTEKERDELLIRVDERIKANFDRLTETANAFSKWRMDHPPVCELPKLEKVLWGNGDSGVISKLNRRVLIIALIAGLGLGERLVEFALRWTL